MSRLGRACAVIPLVFAAVALVAGPARADHCPPIDNPDPVPGQNTDYCHTPKPTAAPKTPAPTTAPTPAPASAAPRTAAPRPAGGGVSRTSAPSTPAGTPFDIEVPDDSEVGSTEVDDITIEDEAFNPKDPETTGGASNTIIGFIVGFLVGALIGRASWGFRRRRGRQQIFG